MSINPNTDLSSPAAPLFLPPVLSADQQEQRARNRTLLAALRAWQAEDTDADDIAAAILEENLNRNKLQLGKVDLDATDS